MGEKELLLTRKEWKGGMAFYPFVLAFYAFKNDLMSLEWRGGKKFFDI